MEHHSLPLLECRASPEGIVTGYAATFGGIDSYGDSIAPGAFQKSISVRRPVMLAHHRMDTPIGRWDVLREDSRGLYVEGTIALKTAAGRDAFEAIRADAISGLSIGFKLSSPTAFERRDDGVRLLRSIDLYEVSVVTIPADSAARIDSVKSLRPETPAELQRLLQQHGFSRRHAAAIVARGFSAIAAADAEEAIEAKHQAALDAIRAAVSTIK